ncbi:MAG: hypothetical protein LWX56_11995, partial [Ignavibacteria bacterium]|nr:hypothetical protein [Ignavibacteria bacterium]
NYRFLSTNIHADHDYWPFFYTSSDYSDVNFTFLEQKNIEDANLSEWQKIFNGQVPLQDLRNVIYDFRLGQIDTLIYYLKDQSFSCPDSIKKMKLTNCTDKALLKEVLYYLGFAKRVEPFTQQSDNWGIPDTKKDTAAIRKAGEKLLLAASKQISNSKSPAITERYHFQIIRLMFYLRKFENCIQYYTENENTFKISATIKYRSAGYAAGAYYALKQYAKANYLYAKIFDGLPILRFTTVSSFYPGEEHEWQASLNLAQTPREKAVLWSMLGLRFDELRAANEILKIDRKSELVDLLILRLAAKQEKKFLPFRYSFDSTNAHLDIHGGTIKPELFEFIAKNASQGGTHNPQLWDMVHAYFCFGERRFDDAKTVFDKMHRYPTLSKKMKEQLQILEAVTLVESASKITQSVENELLPALSAFEKSRPVEMDTTIESQLQSALEWIQLRLAEKYLVQGDTVKAMLLNYGMPIELFKNPERVKNVISFLEAKNLSAYNTVLYKLSPFSLGSLYHHVGILEFARGNFEGSLHYMQEADKIHHAFMKDVKQSASSRIKDMYYEEHFAGQEFPADPFGIQINDYIDRDFAAKKSVTYTKVTFIQKIIEIKKIIESNPPDKANLCFKLANGLYNASLYGTSRRFSFSSVNNYRIFYSEYSPMSFYRDCTLAMQYYRTALELSTNSEFKAKCCFMAAKCEQNIFFENRPDNYNGDFRAGMYFAKMMRDYSSTKYYQEVLKECGYFRTYIKNK